MFENKKSLPSILGLQKEQVLKSWPHYENRQIKKTEFYLESVPIPHGFVKKVDFSFRRCANSVKMVNSADTDQTNRQLHVCIVLDIRHHSAPDKGGGGGG